MEQNKRNRENFWNISGEVSKELMGYLDMAERDSDANWSLADGWFTLFCC